MLIVCPSCATSYMIETASLGAGGRMVRCARCKATWFAGGPQEQASAVVDNVIAEAESAPPEPFLRAPPGDPDPPRTVGDFGRISVEVHDKSFQAQSAEPATSGFAPQAYDGAAAESAAAEPQTIEDAPSLVPPMDEAPAGDAAPAGDRAADGGDQAAQDQDQAVHDRDSDSDDVETFAARRRRLKSRRKQAKRTSRWTAAILVLFAVNVVLIGGRSEVVRYLPQTASLFAAIGLPVNLQHLKFEDVRISASGPTGEGIAVDGTIVSTASEPVKVPMLRFAARNAAGQEIYTWTKAPTRSMLDPGEKLAFHTELASPPADAKDVLVRFVTPQEAADMASRAMQRHGDGQGMSLGQ